MARKKKDKKSAFAESGLLPGGENISLPPDLVLSGLPAAGPDLAEKRRPQKTKAKITLSAAAEAGAKARPAAETTAAKQPQAAARQKQEPHHYDGHRQRLRRRFLDVGEQHMEDYEFLELLLFRSQPRKDTKPLAKALLAHFGSLAEVLSVDIRRLREVKGCGESIAVDLKIIGAATARRLRSELKERNVLASWDKVIAYCRAVMAHEEREQFRVLFLDKKNGLIIDKIMQTGTVDHTPVYPRDVVQSALDFGASSIVLVHNHPSGDPTPSRQDVAMTTSLREAAASINIIIYDHLIIGRNSYTSFRELDLL